MSASTPDRLPVSVVIPAYRASQTLPRAIASIAAQTRWPLEVIVVDDASPDGTWDSIQSLAAQYPSSWIKTIRQPTNQGAGDARNAGWEMAQGDYIAFLDADDSWHPQKLEIQYAYMQANPHVDLCGHAHEVLLGATPSSPLASAPTPEAPPAARRISRTQVLLKNPFITPSVMLKRSLSLRFRKGQRHMEDHALWMELILMKHTAVRLNALLATIHKPAYGASGLSAQLWAMEKAELNNYRHWCVAKHIGFISMCSLSAYSMLKFLRRIILLLANRVIRRSHAASCPDL
jgi:glycosyltransferase involved in cell wall biosynthesis